MHRGQTNYRSYLLRLWWVNDEDTIALRIFIEDPHTGKRTGFSRPEDLVKFLYEEANLKKLSNREGISEESLDTRNVKELGLDRYRRNQMKGGTMLENNKAIMDIATEIWNTGDLSRFDEVYTSDFINHDPFRPDAMDYESLKALIAELHNGMPDHQVVVEDTIAENDKVVTRWVSNGTHTDVLTGIPPTGKHVTWTGMTIYRFERGKIVEAWWNYDMLGALQQIGVIPKLGAA